MRILVRAILFFVLTCIGLPTMAQQKNKTDSLQNHRLSIEISPLSLLNGYEQSYRIGLEVNLYKNLSVYIEGSGYFLINNNFFDLDGRLSNVKGDIIKCELKYYLNQYSEFKRNYLSVQGFYKKQSFDWQDSIHLTPAYLTTFRDFKNVYAFDIKYGQVITYKKRFIVDWYIGIGVRFKNVTSTLTSTQQAALEYDDDNEYDSDLLGDIVNPTGKSIVPDIDLGIRIGYLIF
jgi:hypothetical protein